MIHILKCVPSLWGDSDARTLADYLDVRRLAGLAFPGEPLPTWEDYWEERLLMLLEQHNAC